MAKKTEKSTETKTEKAPAKKASASLKMKAAARPVKTPKPKSSFKTKSPKLALAAKHSSKEALAKTLAEAVAREDEDTDQIVGRLAKASNAQLLRLQAVVETVKSKFGGRAKLIAAIGTADKKAKDKDFLAKLDAMSLPALLDLHRSVASRG